ncbi:MAG: HEAT repeat domain-containing protein [Candidatus Heimdallarchaeota archaeon]|nr:HEAT repeat domain-containing protein [Candidatus Heimdallarchaeota archaeon]
MAVKHLIKALEDENESVRLEALETLEGFEGNPRAIELLKEALKKETDESFIMRIKSVLNKLERT